jgi:hypothetical protein
MATYFESQNLPDIPDIPRDLSLEQQEFFGALKEVLEAMLGRRDDPPRIPQWQIGTYIGNDNVDHRLIATAFRPRMVEVFADPSYNQSNEKYYIRLDDPTLGIDWELWSYKHTDSANYHDFDPNNGITSITDDGFTVQGGTAGGSHPNQYPVKYNWVIFG